jgi:hypothetical protein
MDDSSSDDPWSPTYRATEGEELCFSKVILKVFYPNHNGKNSYKTSCHVYQMSCIEAAEVQMRTYIPQGQHVTFEVCDFKAYDKRGRESLHLIGSISYRRISPFGLETHEFLNSRFDTYAIDWMSIYHDLLCVHPAFRKC